MMVDHPVYRVTWGASPAVIEGKDGVLAFYRSVGESVLWHSDDRLAVGDWGICDEITFHQLARGADLRAVGYDIADDDALYHVSSRQSFVWPYDDRGRLAGEHLYEDKTSLVIEEVSPDEAITPARVREIHREQLAKLEAERGERFWVLTDDAWPDPRSGPEPEEPTTGGHDPRADRVLCPSRPVQTARMDRWGVELALAAARRGRMVRSSQREGVRGARRGA